MRGAVRLQVVSPKGGNRGCLCWDSETYSRECCDGSYHAQGIGQTLSALIPFSDQVWELQKRNWERIHETYNKL